MSNYRVILKGAHGRQVYVKNCGSKTEAHVKACAQGIAEPEDVECVERTTINPEDLDSGRKDGHGCPRVLIPAVPWHRCEFCGRAGHKTNRCPKGKVVSIVETAGTDKTVGYTEIVYQSSRTVAVDNAAPGTDKTVSQLK